MSGYNIVGVVLGVLGALTSADLVRSLVHRNLPTQRLKELDEILDKTVLMYQLAVEEQLLSDSQLIQDIRKDLEE
jgi:hypothetical protein